mmetsp:Transcript_19926/g.29811  ORF Transcript_19926/g.29811 Transcript_19926/m.29811 type:complete len:112 (-) Transcript_19926:915-1250(-)
MLLPPPLKLSGNAYSPNVDILVMICLRARMQPTATFDIRIVEYQVETFCRLDPPALQLLAAIELRVLIALQVELQRPLVVSNPFSLSEVQETQIDAEVFALSCQLKDNPIA